MAPGRRDWGQGGRDPGASRDSRAGRDGARARRASGPAPRSSDEQREPGDDAQSAARRGDQAAAAAGVAAIAALPDEVVVLIDKLVAGGDGFGRIHGVPIFVPRAAPGDRLRVAVVERRPDFVRGEIVEVLTPGPDRREPPCPYFGVCGGCDLQHLEDAAGVRHKAAAVLETLVRLGKLDPTLPLEVVSGEMWAWRMRTQLRTHRGDDGVVEVGYHARRSHQLVAVESCPILVPELEAMLAELPERLSEVAALPSRLDLAATPRAVSVAPPVGELQAKELTVEVAGERLAFDARSFFQGHRGLLERMVQLVVGEWTGARAVDLYSGVGLFALPLARRYESVVAVEGDALATRYARKNALAAPNLEIARTAVESWIPRLAPGVDRVIVDPPRGGLSLSVRRRILEARPARVTYVSCHPAALARDLRELVLGYTIERVALVDLFPQTGHMEVVVQLVAKG